MFCDKCKKRPAAVFVTKVINDIKKEAYLCQECASEDSGVNFSFDPQIVLHKFLSGLMGGINNHVAKTIVNQLVCSNCGLTYQSFAQKGKFGCSNCYTDFQKELQPLLSRIHGSHMHTGKIPQRVGAHITLQKQIEGYKRDLQELVLREEFEKAALLRDQIKELEKRKKGDGNDESKGDSK